jgi:hypothetical protein
VSKDVIFEEYKDWDWDKSSNKEKEIELTWEDKETLDEETDDELISTQEPVEVSSPHNQNNSRELLVNVPESSTTAALRARKDGKEDYQGIFVITLILKVRGSK